MFVATFIIFLKNIKTTPELNNTCFTQQLLPAFLNPPPYNSI